VLANELTEQEFQGWQQYFLEEPFGQSHLDNLVAILTAVVANLMRGEDQDPFSPDDFIPKYKPKDESEADNSVAADLAYINALVQSGMVQRAPKEVQ
jgi:hypothetical protein